MMSAKFSVCQYQIPATSLPFVRFGPPQWRHNMYIFPYLVSCSCLLKLKLGQSWDISYIYSSFFTSRTQISLENAKSTVGHSSFHPWGWTSSGRKRDSTRASSWIEWSFAFTRDALYCLWNWTNAGLVESHLRWKTSLRWSKGLVFRACLSLSFLRENKRVPRFSDS